jgi:hypothetical protein
VKNRRRAKRTPALARNQAGSPENAEKPSPRHAHNRPTVNKPAPPFQANLGRNKIRRLPSFMKYPG